MPVGQRSAGALPPLIVEGPKGALQVGGSALSIIAGPCLLESVELGLAVGRVLRDRCAELGLNYIFKASFDKANRTSLHSPRGPGIGGLDGLAEVRDRLGVPVTTDVHLPAQAAPVADVVDLLQIPAFLCRQTDLLVAAAETGTPVNVKKGQFLSARECGPLVEKGASMLTERGTFFGYHDLVVDFRNLARMREHGVPVVFDCTHSVQRPGIGAQSGGDREHAAALARAAVAFGVDAVFMEVHSDPGQALSDAATQLSVTEALELLTQLQTIVAARRGSH